MRATLVALFVVVAILVATSSGSKLKPKFDVPSLRDGLKKEKLHKLFDHKFKHLKDKTKKPEQEHPTLFKGTSRRLFNTQADLPIELKNTTYCQSSAFQAKLLTTLASCLTLESDMEKMFNAKSSYEMKTLLSTFCPGTCYAGVKTIFSTATDAACFQDFDKDHMGLMGVLCETDGTDYCGVQMMKKEETVYQCYNARNQSSCVSSSYCGWESYGGYYDQSTTYGYCYFDYTKMYELQCSGTCTAKLIAAPVTEDTMELKHMCSKVDNEYCGMLLGDTDLQGLPDRDEWGYVCNTAAGFTCFKNAVADVKKIAERDADRMFAECKKKVSSDYVAAYCAGPLLEAKLAPVLAQLYLNHACSRNSKGKWCFDELDKYETECLWALVENRTCSGDCPTELKNSLADLGCCAGTLDKFFEPIDFASLLPAFTGKTEFVAAVEKEVAKDSGNFRMSNFALCSTINSVDLTACGTVTEIKNEADRCFGKEAFDVEKEIMSSCGAYFSKWDTSAFEKNFSSLTQSNTDFAGFCNSACSKSMIKAKAFIGCLDRDSEERMMVLMMEVMCEMEGTNYCGSILHSLDQFDACDTDSKTVCQSKSQCTWYTSATNANKGSCEATPSSTTLQTVCTTCLVKFVKAMGTSKYGLESAGFLQILCQKEGDNFCYPLVVEDITKLTLDDSIPMQSVKNVCEQSTNAKCMRRVINGAAAMVLGKLEKYRCTSSSCYTQYVAAYTEIRSMLKLVESMCKKNGDNTYCLGFMNEYDNKAGYEGCFEHLPVCNATCDAAFKTMIDTFGCCFGTLHDIFKVPLITADDFPDAESYVKYYRGAFPTPRPTVAVTLKSNEERASDDLGSGFGFYFSQCATAGVNLEQRLSAVCAHARAKNPVARDMAIPISYDKIKNDAKLRAKIINALITDTALALGIPVSDIIDGQLVEDTTRKVEVKHHRMATLAETSATKFNFKIQTESDDAAKAQAAAFDNLVKNNKLTLSTTSNVVNSECSSCVDQGRSLLLQPTTADTENELQRPTAGAGSITTGLLAIIAVIVALFI